MQCALCGETPRTPKRDSTGYYSCCEDGRNCFILRTVYNYKSPAEVQEAIDAGADFLRYHWRPAE